MKVFELFTHIADDFFNRLGPHLIDKFSLHGLGSLIEKVPGKPVTFGSLSRPWTISLLIHQAHIYQATFAHKVYQEPFSHELMKLVSVLTCVQVGVPEITLYFGHDCTHRCKEWS